MPPKPHSAMSCAVSACDIWCIGFEKTWMVVGPAGPFDELRASAAPAAGAVAAVVDFLSAA